ncbi:MAG: hypothetical protein V8R61_02830 [Enterocloster sp.]
MQCEETEPNGSWVNLDGNWYRNRKKTDGMGWNRSVENWYWMDENNSLLYEAAELIIWIKMGSWPGDGRKWTESGIISTKMEA